MRVGISTFAGVTATCPDTYDLIGRAGPSLHLGTPPCQGSWELCVIYRRIPGGGLHWNGSSGNLDKAKLKLDRPFFYLDEIEELIQEDELDEAPVEAARPQSGSPNELSALSGKVAELQSILLALDEQQKADSPQRQLAGVACQPP